jgi:hypothetical protein
MKGEILIGFFVLFVVGDARADPRDDVMSAMLRCSAIDDLSLRLGCYDRTVARVPGAMNNASLLPSPTVASAVPPQAAPLVPRRRQASFVDRLFGPDGPKRAPQTSVAEFGSESIANGGREAYPIHMDGDTINQISARLVNYQFSDGYVIVTLDNGQVWRQTDDGQPLQHLSRPPLSYMAIIGRGHGSNYAMKVNSIWREIPVRRIQ